MDEQLRLGHELKRKMEGGRGSDDSDYSDTDASTSASGSDDEGGERRAGQQLGGRTRAAAIDILAGGCRASVERSGAPLASSGQQGFRPNGGGTLKHLPVQI